jgi:hypothetical protein
LSNYRFPDSSPGRQYILQQEKVIREREAELEKLKKEIERAEVGRKDLFKIEELF